MATSNNAVDRITGNRNYQNFWKSSDNLKFYGETKLNQKKKENSTGFFSKKTNTYEEYRRQKKKKENGRRRI